MSFFPGRKHQETFRFELILRQILGSPNSWLVPLHLEKLDWSPWPQRSLKAATSVGIRPLTCLGTPCSWGSLAVHQAACVKSPLSQSASLHSCLPNLQAKWTYCCSKPQFLCIKQFFAWKSCQQTCKQWSCQMAESHFEGARCPDKRGATLP